MDALWRVDLIIHVGGAVQIACKVKITLGAILGLETQWISQ